MLELESELRYTKSRASLIPIGSFLLLDNKTSSPSDVGPIKSYRQSFGRYVEYNVSCFNGKVCYLSG